MDKKKTKKDAGKKVAAKKTPLKKKPVAKKAKPAAKPHKAAAKNPATSRASKAAAPTVATETQTRPVVEVQAQPKVIPAARKYAGPTLRIRWFRSAIALPEKQKKVVKGLGFHRLNEIIVRPDTPMIRGMVKCIPHLVEIVE